MNKFTKASKHQKVSKFLTKIIAYGMTCMTILIMKKQSTAQLSVSLHNAHKTHTRYFVKLKLNTPFTSAAHSTLKSHHPFVIAPAKL